MDPEPSVPGSERGKAEEAPRHKTGSPVLTPFGLPDWDAFLDHLRENESGDGPARHNALGLKPLSFENGLLTLEVDNAQQMAALNRESSRLEQALASWLKRPCRIRLILKEQPPTASRKPLPSPEEVAQKPELKYCMKILKARVRDVRRKTD